MKWNLEVQIDQKSSFKRISHSDHLLSVGSCFSEHMGAKLKAGGWRIAGNPFGILYNPYSIMTALDRIVSGEKYTERELMEHNGRWISLDHHGSFSDADKQKALRKINISLDQAHDHLKNASTLIVTFGTAFFYTWKEDGRIVGNNHKIPAGMFERFRASIADIVEAYELLFERMGQFNGDLQWIFTVSPVRHWKNGAADNQWSKSILICAIRELAEDIDNVHYFPSYELLMDELRDHRFYEEDLLHPNTQAIDHIWSKFNDNCLYDEARITCQEVMKLRKRMQHKLFFPESEESKLFIEETGRLIADLKVRYPYIELDKEV